MTLPPEEKRFYSHEFPLIKVEVRMQYLEKEEIKEIQLALLDYIDETCKKHDIPYFSKLWNHAWSYPPQGMIPWDDDIDISLYREDYDRLLKIIVEETHPVIRFSPTTLLLGTSIISHRFWILLLLSKTMLSTSVTTPVSLSMSSQLIALQT